MRRPLLAALGIEAVLVLWLAGAARLAGPVIAGWLMSPAALGVGLAAGLAGPVIARRHPLARLAGRHRALVHRLGRKTP